MAKFSTRSQTLLVAFVSLGAVGAALLYSGFPNRAPEVSAAIQASPSGAIEQIPDNGDWKQSFLSSNGSAAGNPTGTKKTTGSAQKETLTSKFGKDFFTQFINLKQAKLTDNKDVVESMTNNLISQDYVNADKPRNYAPSEITVMADNTTTALKIYGNGIGYILKTYTPEKSDAYIAYKAIQNGTPYAGELDGNISKYKTIIRELLKLPVPSSLSEAHLNLINGVSSLISMATALKSTESDPLRSMVGLGAYSDTSEGLFNALNAVKRMLLANGIRYSRSDAGSYLNLESFK